MPPRILIFGSGAVGSVYAYLLSRHVGEENVFTVCRSNYDIASTQGFTINSTLLGDNLKFHPRVVKTVADGVSLANNEPFDYVVITAKAIDPPSIVSQIKPAVTEKTTIALIQNGIAIEEPYRSAFPENPILSCVVYLPATQISPAVISHGEVELLHIGTYPSTAPESHKTAASNFTSLLTTAKATAQNHDDVQLQRWDKLLVNAAWNPICALSHCRDVQFQHSSSYALNLVKSVMLEIASIAQASGYESINVEKIEHQIGRAKARDLPGVQPSMMADALAGRRMEVEAIVGNALRIAEEKGVKTPCLGLVYALIKGLDERMKDGSAMNSPWTKGAKQGQEQT